MREKEVWTVLGRKKIFLVDDENQVVKEVKDLGPLSELEKKYVNSNCGMSYDDWLETLKNEEEEDVGEGAHPDECTCSCGGIHSDKQGTESETSKDDE